MNELDNDDMTGLDRVRRQIDRALNRSDPSEAERKKQVELREEVEQLLLPESSRKAPYLKVGDIRRAS
jgi:hypothetical protein